MKTYIATPIGHTEAERLKQEFETLAEAQAFCDAENAEIIKEYESEEHWRNDEHSIQWIVE